LRTAHAQDQLVLYNTVQPRFNFQSSSAHKLWLTPWNISRLVKLKFLVHLQELHSHCWVWTFICLPTESNILPTKGHTVLLLRGSTQCCPCWLQENNTYTYLLWHSFYYSTAGCWNSCIAVEEIKRVANGIGHHYYGSFFWGHSQPSIMQDILRYFVWLHV